MERVSFIWIGFIKLNNIYLKHFFIMHIIVYDITLYIALHNIHINDRKSDFPEVTRNKLIIFELQFYVFSKYCVHSNQVVLLS